MRILWLSRSDKTSLKRLVGDQIVRMSQINGQGAELANRRLQPLGHSSIQNFSLREMRLKALSLSGLGPDSRQKGALLP